MKKRFFAAAVFIFLAVAALSLANDFNEHFLAAGCSGKNLNIVTTPNGPACGFSLRRCRSAGPG